MNPTQIRRALNAAMAAARAAGALMHKNARKPKAIHSQTQHDVKLELDVRCQKVIERLLLRAFPDVAILGEEGVNGPADANARWVVDPIDGTVNFTYNIPHACVSIALQVRDGDRWLTEAGVVFDPFQDEMWTAIRGGRARLNGRVIQVSTRSSLQNSILALGFAKEKSTLEHMLPSFNRLVHRVRKIRIMGAAALSLTYVASGRMDGYVEYGLRLWDIAAGGLILECAGGEFWHRPLPGEHTFELVATNGKLRRKIDRVYGRKNSNRLSGRV